MRLSTKIYQYLYLDTSNDGIFASDIPDIGETWEEFIAWSNELSASIRLYLDID